LRADWNSLASIPAVQNKKIYFITDKSSLIAGPRIAQAAAEVCRVLKPALPPARP
jgi:ABC-type hemin transport system substrate-binding protein